MLLHMHRLIVRRKTGILDVFEECTVYDTTGKALGYVRPERKVKRGWLLARLRGRIPYLPRTLRVDDVTEGTVLRIEIPWIILRTKLRVFHSDSKLVGFIRQRELLRKWHFDLVSTNESIGVIVAEDSRAWRFRVLDPRGEEMGWIRKRWHGTLREQWTTGSAYDLQLHPNATSTLRLLALAAAVSVDLVFKTGDILDADSGSFTPEG